MAIQTSVAYNTLVANPAEFLRKYPVRIFGHTGASGTWRYYLLNRSQSKRPGSVLGNLRMHDTESFEIRANGGPMMAVGFGNGEHPFDAQSVHMDVGLPNMGFFRLGAGGSNIMVTGQLSGCSFVMIPAGPGQVDVAHVKPAGQDGKALFDNIAINNPNAQIYGAAGTKGNYDSDDRVASIIGVRAGAGWTIYAQKQLQASGTDYRIKSVYRIYPTRTKVS